MNEITASGWKISPIEHIFHYAEKISGAMFSLFCITIYSPLERGRVILPNITDRISKLNECICMRRRIPQQQSNHRMCFLPDTLNCGLRMRREWRECFPSTNFKGNARAVMHVGISNLRWRGNCSRHSQLMRNPQFYVSGERPIANLPTSL